MAPRATRGHAASLLCVPRDLLVGWLGGPATAGRRLGIDGGLDQLFASGSVYIISLHGPGCAPSTSTELCSCAAERVGRRGVLRARVQMRGSLWLLGSTHVKDPTERDAHVRLDWR